MARARATRVAALFGAVALLAACGQRGPLYLPDSPPGKKLNASAPRDAAPPPAATTHPSPRATHT